MLSERAQRLLPTLWEKTGGKAWEPPRRDNPVLNELVSAGYLKHCTLRFFFEAFDTGITWTDAGRKAMASTAPERLALNDATAERK